MRIATVSPRGVPFHIGSHDAPALRRALGIGARGGIAATGLALAAGAAGMHEFVEVSLKRLATT